MRTGSCNGTLRQFPTSQDVSPQHIPDTRAYRVQRDLQRHPKADPRQTVPPHQSLHATSQLCLSPTPSPRDQAPAHAQPAQPQRQTPDGSSHRGRPNSFRLPARATAPSNAESTHTQTLQRRTGPQCMQRNRSGSTETDGDDPVSPAGPISEWSPSTSYRSRPSSRSTGCSPLPRTLQRARPDRAHSCPAVSGKTAHAPPPHTTDAKD